MNHLRLAAALSLALLFFASPALAQSPIDKEAALDADFDTLIDQARDAFGEQDFEAALEYLVIANRLDDEPRLFLNIARSYEELDQCQRALVYYEAFLKSDEDEQALRDRAQQALDEGIPECPEYSDELGGRLLLESEPQLADVYIDGEFIGTTPTETVAIAPGTVEIRFERPGFETHVEQVDIVADREMELRPTLSEESEEEPVVEEPPASSTPDREPQAFTLNPIALGLVGVGAAGLGVGLYLDLVELPSIDESREDAEAAGDRDEYSALTEQRASMARNTIAAYVAGGVFVAGGAGWLLYEYWAHSQGASQQASWQLAPAIGPSGASMTLFGRF